LQDCVKTNAFRKAGNGRHKARLVVLIDPKNKAAFDAICASRDQTASEVIRQLIGGLLARHGVPWPTA